MGKRLVDPITAGCLKEAYKKAKHAYYAGDSKDTSLYNKALELKRRWKFASGYEKTDDVSVSPKRSQDREGNATFKDEEEDDDKNDDDPLPPLTELPESSDDDDE